MKLQFEPNLNYQNQAISSVINLFEGQNPVKGLFTISNSYNNRGLFDSDNGIGNKLELTKDDILDNLKNIQLRNGLAQSESLKSGLDFDIEMETGTGKTYVYIKSILELNKKYGFCKFIIVVPSIAIKEGVNKTLEITKEHFSSLYDNTMYDFFIYDSSKLEQVRSFAVADHISIMVINIDAFRKSFDDPSEESKANIIHRANDKLNGMKPIDLIRETNPILIIDEPQSVDTTPKSAKALEGLNPLITFRYSATHVKRHNSLYKLDAVDAFNLNLVKGIEVTSFESENYHNRAYVRLVSVNNGKAPITARVEVDIKSKNGIRREIKTVKDGDDLYDITSRDIYENYIVDEIYCGQGEEFINFSSLKEPLMLGKSIGDIDELSVKEQQIEATIAEHLSKQLQLKKDGIKVLSLFFIDKVSNYRKYDEDGNPQKGIYAQMFEKSFKKISKRKTYEALFEGTNIDELAESIHNGYFSVDKKGNIKDTKGNTLADEDVYGLIMKDKEKLISFDSTLSFIFSHSALREGWDNPNVFQICTLNETNSEVKKRQEIGRGLRLCVNQKGERQYDPSLNILTVMANESYEKFCGKLQKEYEEENGIRFGVIEKHSFANVVYTINNKYIPLCSEVSEKIFNYCIDEELIDKKGNIQEKLKISIEEDFFNIKDIVEASVIENIKKETGSDIVDDQKLDEIIEEIVSSVKFKCNKAMAGLKIERASEKRKVSLNKEVYISPDFKILWDKIKEKTTYRVDFDSSDIVKTCVEELKEKLTISNSKLILTKAKVKIDEGGVDSKEVERRTVNQQGYNEELPDIVSYLQNSTNLTRKTIVDILIKSKTLDLFKKNPQKYMDEVSKYISSVMRLMIVDGIKYTKIGEDSFYAQELFETEELIGYLGKNMLECDKKRSLFEYVVYDSDIEKTFAEKLNDNKSVKLFAKLPSWFKINTPLGGYNPDWAIVIEKDEKDKLYFVVETKGSISTEDLRHKESHKIKCAYKHFEALKTESKFNVVDNFNNFTDSI